MGLVPACCAHGRIREDAGDVGGSNIDLHNAVSLSSRGRQGCVVGAWTLIELIFELLIRYSDIAEQKRRYVVWNCEALLALLETEFAGYDHSGRATRPPPPSSLCGSPANGSWYYPAIGIWVSMHLRCRRIIGSCHSNKQQGNSICHPTSNSLS
jgi:hypothetical protein